MTQAIASLLVNKLALTLHLGWPENERLKKQTVLIDIDIRYQQAPAACVTDKLDDTVCYSILIKAIKDHVGDNHYLLIEHLSRDLYDHIKSFYPADARIIVRIHKRPHIDALTGGVCFSYGDEA